VSADVRARYAELPSQVSVRGREVDIQYDVEEGTHGLFGVARLRLPEKLARTLVEQELPVLDRPLRFIVARGARGAARADTLEALREELDRPFTESEIADIERAHDERRSERHDRKRDRGVRESGNRLKRHRSESGDRAERGPKRGRFRPPGKRGRGGGRRRRG
jgi:ATP-dependent RNA helicase HrpA